MSTMVRIVRDAADCPRGDPIIRTAVKATSVRGAGLGLEAGISPFGVAGFPFGVQGKPHTRHQQW